MRVHYRRRTRLSGRALERALSQAGYAGRPINWGYSLVDGYNSRAGHYNKRTALAKMAADGVPTPPLYDITQARDRVWRVSQVRLVGRPDRHFGGSGFHLIGGSYPEGREQLERAIARGCSHFTEYIENAREFRVHIAFGKSIKIAEKVGGSGPVRNSKNGYYFAYPDFDHKLTLRKVAKDAVVSIGLDFGAVDVLYSEGKFFVLEVNSAPSLTSRSDTLERYVKAFEREYEAKH